MPIDAKNFLAHVSTRSGVYKMHGAQGEVLYVGKALNLRNRLNSYFQSNLAPKTAALMKRVEEITTIVTDSEVGALVLESNLIKALKPYYNILFRDDKTYPYIVLSDHAYPRLDRYRSKHRPQNECFGPFPSGSAVRDSINLLQKLFKIRSCHDPEFQNRSRPCLQYQINRCSAPCVGFISEEDYACDVERVRLFLQGKSQQLISDCIHQMEQAALAQEFELAARYRNQINALRRVQEQQSMEYKSGDIDVIALAHHAEKVGVSVMMIRSGRLLGHESFFPQVNLESSDEDILQAFLMHYYLQVVGARQLPRWIIVDRPFSEQAWLNQTLRKAAGHKVVISHKVRGKRAEWLNMASENALNATRQLVASRMNTYKRFVALQEHLQLEKVPQRIECFDISHSSGEATRAACVVYDRNGPQRGQYRRYSIRDAKACDDYAAIAEAIHRRFRHGAQKGVPLPEIVIIDGGQGQLQRAAEVLASLGLDDRVLLAIAKGPARKVGAETVLRFGQSEPLAIQQHPEVFHLLLSIRDEAHRFAITGHRAARDKARRVSTLEAVPGIGPAKRRALLNRFGGLQALRAASIIELEKVDGISHIMAQRIYESLRE